MIHGKSTSELILELNQLDECDSIEAKAITGDDTGSSIYETICAFANEPNLSGGIILLGLRRDDSQLFPFYEIHGVKNPDKISSDIMSACQNKYNIPIRPTIKREFVDKKVIIRVEISELQASQKPVFIKNLGLPRGAMRRIGSSDVHCTHEDLAAFYQDSFANTYDAHSIPNSRVQDIDPEAIRLYRKYISEFRPSSEMLQWNDQELLIGTTCVTPIDGGARATATGILSLGKSTALRRFFPATRADYIRIQGKQWVADPSNRFVSIDLRGPIISLIDRIISAINDDLPTAFKLTDENGARRSEVPIVPYKAIREAVVNALMHRNYKVARPVQIVRYSNRLVIENPGYSLKASEQFDKPGSVIRNPHIAAILHETRFAETKGSGMRVMRKELQQVGLSVPTFESDRENDLFRVTFLFHHLLGKEEWEWLGKYKELALNDDLLRALVFVRETEQISNLTFRDISGLDTLAASNGLRRLRTLGLLDKKGSGSATYYVASPRLMDDIAAISNGDSLQDKVPNLQGSDKNLQDNALIAALKAPDSVKRRIRFFLMGRRADPEEVRTLILDICRHGVFSRDQIASIINRDPVYVAQTYLSGLLKEGKLEMEYPDIPNHPSQRYLTARRRDAK
jgi:ATP-dependent DNA helicase RecG